MAVGSGVSFLCASGSCRIVASGGGSFMSKKYVGMPVKSAENCKGGHL